MFIDFRVRGRERERVSEQERAREGETSMCERNIYHLPPICSLAGDQTHNILVYGMTLQPTEHPARVHHNIFKNEDT